MKRIEKTLAAKVLISVVSAALSFVLGEQILRVFLFGTDSFSIQKMSSLHYIEDSGLIRASEYPELVYELKPNRDTFFKLATFTTNSAGLRDIEYSMPKPPGVVRIAVIGDSFSMPSGVEIEDAFHSLIESRLNSDHRGTKYEVLNFAVGGYDLRQYLATMVLKAEAYDPDVFLVGFCPENDYIQRADKLYETPYWVRGRQPGFVRLFSLETIANIFLSRSTGGIQASVPGAWSNAQREYVSSYFDKMGAMSEQKGVPVLVMYLHYVHVPSAVNELRSCALEHGLDFVDLSRRFSATRTSRYWINPTDRHPNKEANAIFGDTLYFDVTHRYFAH